MAQALLGETVDIHAGGVDLMFPHHEDEIAQSEAATGQPFVRTWLHAEFLRVGGTKMSKRYGNIVTARDLCEDGWDAAAIRTLFCSTHYRKQLQFTDDALHAAARGAARLAEFRARLAAAAPGGAAGALVSIAERFEAEFRAALDDDLDAPRALAGLMDFVRDANREIDHGGGAPPAERDAVLAVFDRVSDVLQVVPDVARDDAGDAGLAWARAQAEVRREAKAARDFARADQIRRLLLERGFEVRDARDGSFEVRRVAGGPA
jgi:cysteinyl-tRNA synthetase